MVANNTTYTTNNMKLHLYTNGWTPSPSDVVGDYSESVAAGYAPVTIPGAAWVDGNVTLGGQITCPSQTFTFTAGDTIIGYFLTDLTGSIFMAAERFGSPIVIPGFGGILTVSVELEIIVC